jgi:hypothetical protein
MQLQGILRLLYSTGRLHCFWCCRHCWLLLLLCHVLFQPPDCLQGLGGCRLNLRQPEQYRDSTAGQQEGVRLGAQKCVCPTERCAAAQGLCECLLHLSQPEQYMYSACTVQGQYRDSTVHGQCGQYSGTAGGRVTWDANVCASHRSCLLGP